MNEDYLWDRSGPEDPEIARLERSLGTLRAQDPPAPLRLPATFATPRCLRAVATAGDRRPREALPGLAAIRVAVRCRRDGGAGGRHVMAVGPSVRTAAVLADLTARRHAARGVTGDVRTNRPAPGRRMGRNRRSGARAHQGGAYRSRRRRAGLAGRPDEHAPRQLSPAPRTRRAPGAHPRAAGTVSRRDTGGRGDRPWLRLPARRGRARRERTEGVIGMGLARSSSRSGVRAGPPRPPHRQRPRRRSCDRARGVWRSLAPGRGPVRARRSWRTSRRASSRRFA